MKTTRYENARRGFTLVELLVVILIVGLISAATLPVVLPAFNHRQVSEGARLLQATLAGARDSAIRANAPRGIRLLPDPAFPGPNPLAANRMIAIEPAPDYTSGRVSILAEDLFTGTTGVVAIPTITRISVSESVLPSSSNPPVPDEPTSWYWNIRQGDKIRFDDSGRYYTIAGPVVIGASVQGASANVERYVNFGPPGYVPATIGLGPWSPTSWTSAQIASNPDPTAGPTAHFPERLYLVNGQDDDGDGWIDEGFDGIDNDGDGVVDPGFNGIDDNNDGQIDDPGELIFSAPGYPPGGEYEPEAFIGTQYTAFYIAKPYTIFRRPVVTEGAREVALPQGVVIDMTTWNAASAFLGNPGSPTPATSLPERSRLPVDPYAMTVDIMIAPNGQVIPSGPGQASANAGSKLASPTSSMPFYHFWIAERDDVFEPLWGVGNPIANPGQGRATVVNYVVPHANPAYSSTPKLQYLLPMPEGTPNYDPHAIDSTRGTNPYLKGERRIVTLFVRTGQVLTNEVEFFDGSDTNRPYYDAQFGLRETK